jgi:hypothetical protein
MHGGYSACLLGQEMECLAQHTVGGWVGPWVGAARQADTSDTSDGLTDTAHAYPALWSTANAVCMPTLDDWATTTRAGGRNRKHITKATSLVH